MLCGGDSLSGETGTSSISTLIPFGIEKKKFVLSVGTSSSDHERFEGLSGFGSRDDEVE